MSALKEANQYRAIRKRCMPLFDMAQDKAPVIQETIQQMMVLHIADVLGVDATDDDLYAPLPWERISEGMTEGDIIRLHGWTPAA